MKKDNSTGSNVTIGKNIKALREQMGLTQEALSEFLSVSREYIAYYESGSRAVPSVHLSKLANLFCLSEYDFYEEDKEVSKVNLAFAFRADQVSTEDLNSIAEFKKIVRNYLNMKKVTKDG
jgi:transcriptional regulator with XRE-family HTH domain